MSLNNETKNPGCTGTLPVEAIRGLEHFNAGEYWLAHEALEQAWIAESDPVRNLYKGILQAGVTYLHIQRGNFPGAIKVYRRAIRWLEQYPAKCRGVDVSQLRSDLSAVITEVRRLGPNRISEFNPQFYKPAIYDHD